jgi:[pyruvate, water dikinase]-phosphate phosphotransferase / [pyruvate, water dikinase] kinase
MIRVGDREERGWFAVRPERGGVVHRSSPAEAAAAGDGLGAPPPLWGIDGGGRWVPASTGAWGGPAATSEGRGAVRLHMHLVSDSTGETVTTVARAAVSQFEEVVPVEHVWSFVRTRAQVDKVLSIIKALPGLVIFTLVSSDLREALEEGCRELNTPCVPVLDGVSVAISSLVGKEGRPRIGGQHAMNAGYFSRIEAMDFMLRHDDGQCPDELDGADVVLVGVSRTSKTPTCIYLANRGVKAGNVPVVPGIDLPPRLARLSRPLVVGLTIRPEALVQIRTHRVRLLGRGGATRPPPTADEAGGGPMIDPAAEEDAARLSRFGGDYVELERVRAEVVHARRLFARHGWPVIDVTRRSVEETAAAILQHMQARQDPDLRGAVPGAV